MAEQYVENVLLRKTIETEVVPTPLVAVEDLGSAYEFEGILTLRRVVTNTNDVDGEDGTTTYEYVFDINSIDKLQKEV